MTDQFEEIRKRHKTKLQFEGAVAYRQANDDIGALLGMLDTLLPAAQQVSGLLDAIRKDTPSLAGPGVRDLYQAIDEDLKAALGAVTK